MKSEPQENFITVVLGEQRVGKSYANNIEAINYVKHNRHTDKPPRKALIFDKKNEYINIKTLDPAPDNIVNFVNQKQIEARRIVGRNPNGAPMKPIDCIVIIENIVTYMRNALLVFDDIDGYAAYAKGQDIIGMLTGCAHIGCDVITSHQSWRKITTTESDNAAIIRLHKTQDTPDSMSSSKQDSLDYELCSIADIIVKGQYQMAEDAYAENKITKNEWLSLRSFFLYLDVKRHKMWPITQMETFKLAFEEYIELRSPILLRDELKRMQMEGLITLKDAKNPKDDTRQQALDRLLQPRLSYVRCPQNPKLNLQNHETKLV